MSINSHNASADIPEGLFEATLSLLERLPNSFGRIEPHDPNVPESADRLWLAGIEPTDFCEGEYVAVLSEGPGYCDIEHCEANTTGGHPNVWGAGGPQGWVLDKAVSMYKGHTA